MHQMVRAGGGVTIAEVVDAALAEVAVVCPAEAAFVAEQRDLMSAPPTVLIAGRVNAGKSTLVNALIGAPVAETAAIEATQTVTEFRDGAPARAEVDGVDGCVRHLQMRAGTEPVVLPIPASQVLRVRRWLPSAALRELRLIDTPGLATLTVTVAQSATRALTDGPARSASIDADVAAFLFDADLRADEHEILARWQFTPLTTVGVLARADTYGAGAFGDVDPIRAACDRARMLGPSLHMLADRLVAVSAVAAQAAATGMLTESDSRALAALADCDRWVLADAVDSDATIARLVERYGEFGVVRGRDVAARGGVALHAWLRAQSGLDEFRAAVIAAAARYGPLRRTLAVLANLELHARTSPQHQLLRSTMHRIQSDPQFARVQIFSDYRRLVRSSGRSPFTVELRRLLAFDDPPRQLGLPESAGGGEVIAAARHHLEQAQAASVAATSSAAVESARLTLVAAYQSLVDGGTP